MMPKPLQAGGVPIWVSGSVNPRVAPAPRPLRSSVDPVVGAGGRPRG